MLSQQSGCFAPASRPLFYSEKARLDIRYTVLPFSLATAAEYATGMDESMLVWGLARSESYFQNGYWLAACGVSCCEQTETLNQAPLAPFSLRGMSSGVSSCCFGLSCQCVSKVGGPKNLLSTCYDGTWPFLWKPQPQKGKIPWTPGMALKHASFRKLGVPHFGVLVIRILLFRVLY